jgi:hypothetical protein
MSDLMHEIDSLLDVLNKFMLPGSLEDCFQAYREELIKRVGERFNDNLQCWFLREISVLRGEEELTSVVQACDPFLHLPSGCWGFFRRRSGFFREGDQQFCDSDQESERSDAGRVIVAEVIGIVKQAA